MALPRESARTVSTSLAVRAGALQLILYLARLESLMSFVSQPVVIGYITGAAVLIGISQLPNITRSTADGASIVMQVYSWGINLNQTHIPSVLVGIATIGVTLGLRQWNKKIPADMLALVMMSAAVLAAGNDLGIKCVQDLSPIPKGLPKSEHAKPGHHDRAWSTCICDCDAVFG